MRDGGVVHLESGFDAAAHEGLRARGHRIEPASGGFGGYQAIRRIWRPAFITALPNRARTGTPGLLREGNDGYGS